MDDFGDHLEVQQWKLLHKLVQTWHYWAQYVADRWASMYISSRISLAEKPWKSSFFLTFTPLNLNYSDFLKNRTSSASFFFFRFFALHLPPPFTYPSPLSGVSVGERLLPRGRTVAVTMGMGSAEHLNYWVGQLISIKAWLIFHQRLKAGTSTQVHRGWKGLVGDKREQEEDEDGGAATSTTERDDKMRCKRRRKGRGSEKDGFEGLELQRSSEQQKANHVARLCSKSLPNHYNLHHRASLTLISPIKWTESIPQDTIRDN